MLKRDHELLSSCIHEEADGSITITRNPASTRLLRGGPNSTSSGSSIDSAEDLRSNKQKLWNSARFTSS